jgi:hypothetical protein
MKLKERRKKKERRKNVYIKREKNNKAPRLSRCIRSLKMIQDQDPHSSFQPGAIR